jgi:hypothetical protein
MALHLFWMISSDLFSGPRSLDALLLGFSPFVRRNIIYKAFERLYALKWAISVAFLYFGLFKSLRPRKNGIVTGSREKRAEGQLED